MSLAQAARDVLGLQASYSFKNTPEMEWRGQLVRQAIPAGISSLRSVLARSAGTSEQDLFIEGKDGVGRKSGIPWVRFSSRALSPNATSGWYVVWLFRRDGAGVYLALAHGSTKFDGGTFVPRPDSELASMMEWSRGVVQRDMAHDVALRTDVDLASSGSLAVAYQKSCVCAFYFPTDRIPGDDELQRRMIFMAGLLGRLYEAERLGQTPVSENPEVRDAENAATAISRPTANSFGQGFALTAEERRAVELHAMRLATERLEHEGFSVVDVSANKSFDLLASREHQEFKVEVKGTTGEAASILLTANEVRLHQEAFPGNALIVVHSISLSSVDVGGAAQASGGIIMLWLPWEVNSASLTPITYSYRIDT